MKAIFKKTGVIDLQSDDTCLSINEPDTGNISVLACGFQVQDEDGIGTPMPVPATTMGVDDRTVTISKVEDLTRSKSIRITYYPSSISYDRITSDEMESIIVPYTASAWVEQSRTAISFDIEYVE